MKFIVPGLTVAALFLYQHVVAQKADSIMPRVIQVPAGAEYKTSEKHQRRWGKNYRIDWYTPVTLPVVYLDTLRGGLTPLKAGGGNQTKSLQLEDKNGRVFTMRSVNKTLGKVLPPDFLGTFIEDILNDEVSMSYPYGAAPAAYLAGKASIYHTNPTYLYVPKQAALDTFPNFGDAVYLLEEKLDGNWKSADHLGNFEDFMGTTKVLDSVLANHKYKADQKTYIKSRLFDMLINDWDRHEDQWEWGTVKNGDHKLFVPVPQDRDQAFYKYDGSILSFLLSASGMKYFQPFDVTMRDVKSFNYEQRNLDRFFANEMTLNDWQQAARNMKESLSDEVIETAVKLVPAEVKNVSSSEIAAKLKGRRERMEEYATIYYRFLAKEVDIPGAKTAERFEVNRLTENETTVKIFGADGKASPVYARTFFANETDEIRIYGIGGNDQFAVTGENNRHSIRLIGGPERDSMMIQGSGIHVYDNKDNQFEAAPGTRYHLSKKDKVHEFKYAAYTYDKSGFKPTFSFNNEDMFYVGLGYGVLKHKWRKEPFAYKQDLSLNFSLSQGGLSVNYDGIYKKFIGKWDLALTGKWDAIRWTNFFGLGNETKFEADRMYFYRARSEQWLGRVGLMRKFGHLNVRFNGIYQNIRVFRDEDRFTGKFLTNVFPDLTVIKQFGGGEFLYNLHSLNDTIIPTKGYIFWGRASYLQNLRNSDRQVGNFQANLRFYVPLAGKFSLIFAGGGETVTGKPEFYQHAFLGGGQMFRGLRNGRFWGKSAYYNNNELRYMTNVKGHVYNGKIGFLTFFDNGRVWMPGEQSNTIHTSVGAGILLAPFNKLYGEITYAMSDVDNLIQLRLNIPVR